LKEQIVEYCKQYCNTFFSSIAIAIAILFASIANNPADIVRGLHQEGEWNE